MYSPRLRLLIQGCVLLLGAAGVVQGRDRPLLIQWGQTTPDTRLMRKYSTFWEHRLPFDGVVIPINQERYAGRYGTTAANILGPEHWPLSFTVFGDARANPAEYRHAIEDMRRTPFRRFKHNFIPLIPYPRMHFVMDWFDDDAWIVICRNVAVLAEIAQRSGCRGIWFDTEQYGPPRFFNYVELKRIFADGPQDFESYQKAAFGRGREFIRAINGAFPGIDLVLAFGNCIIQADLETYEPAKGKHFSQARYALLAPFLDGMMAAADAESSFTDGYELSYYYTTEQEFNRAGPVVRDACRAFSLDPERYAERIRLGLGLYPTHHGMFNPRDFSGNKFTPESLAEAVRLSFRMTDRYVWIWNEAASFWIPGGPDGEPLLPLQPAVDSENPAPSYLTAVPTLENALHPRYYGVPLEYVDALADGKRGALRGQKFIPKPMNPWRFEQ